MKWYISLSAIRINDWFFKHYLQSLICLLLSIFFSTTHLKSDCLYKCNASFGVEILLEIILRKQQLLSLSFCCWIISKGEETCWGTWETVAYFPMCCADLFFLKRDDKWNHVSDWHVPWFDIWQYGFSCQSEWEGLLGCPSHHKFHFNPRWPQLTIVRLMTRHIVRV